MIYTFTEDSPIYLQLAQLLKDDIFLGIYKEETAIPSAHKSSNSFKGNEHTLTRRFNRKETGNWNVCQSKCKEKNYRGKKE